MAPVNKPKHKGKALVAGASAGILGEWSMIWTVYSGEISVGGYLDSMPCYSIGGMLLSRVVDIAIYMLLLVFMETRVLELVIILKHIQYVYHE